MDQREALCAGTELILQDKHCIIDKEVGRGSNAIVYQGRYPDGLNTKEWHTVLIKELFPYHPHGAIFRDNDNSIVCRDEGTSIWNEHLQSFKNGNRIHIRMVNSFPTDIGSNIDTYLCNNTYYTLLGFNGGRSMLEDQRSGNLPLRRLAVRMAHLLEALACFHQSGYLHLDIAPDNIVLLGSGNRERVMLIDYNNVYTIAFLNEEPGFFSVKAGYTAPEVRSGNLYSISQASDLYSVAAVFFQCLTGSALTPYQTSRPAPPDVSGAPCLVDQPDTVQSMVRQILTRGLAALPRRRYQTTTEMLQDFEELIDRIDGVGITHCSLWEAGRKSVFRLMRENAALSYLAQADDFFPVYVQRASGETEAIEKCLRSLREPNAKNLILVGGGGAGKTTALLKFVLSSQANFAPDQPAVFYLSLYARRDNNIRLLDLLLENMHFKPETRSFEDARQTLTFLLDMPIRTSHGDLPTLVLLVDGLNEYNGPKAALLEDLHRLASLRGIRLLIADRGGEEKLPAEPVNILGLKSTDVTNILRSHGLVPPESQSLLELLRSPLMLSIFLRSAKAKDSQIIISTQEELLDTYFSALINKERRLLSEESDEYWLTDAAMRLVLPTIAEELRRRGRPLSDAELSPLIKRLFAMTRRNALLSKFGWGGRSAAIRGRVNTADEWYELVVHRILWKRLALLIRLDGERYQLPHDVIREHLADDFRRNVGKLRRRFTLIRTCRALSFLSMVIIIAVFWSIQTKKEAKPVPYDSESTLTVLSLGCSAYDCASRRTEAFHDMIAHLDPADSKGRNTVQLLYYEIIEDIDTVSNAILYDSETGGIKTYIYKAISKLLESGEEFADSGMALDEKNYLELIGLERKLAMDYAPMVEALHHIIDNSDNFSSDWLEAYYAKLEKMADLEAEYAGVLYHLAVAPNIITLLETDPSFSKAYSISEYQASHEPVSLSRDELILELHRLEENLEGLDGIKSAIRSDMNFINYRLGYLSGSQHEKRRNQLENISENADAEQEIGRIPVSWLR